MVFDRGWVQCRHELNFGNYSLAIISNKLVWWFSYTNWFILIILYFSSQAENDKKLDTLGITHIMNITSTYKPFDKYTYLCVGNIMDSDSDANILKP